MSILDNLFSEDKWNEFLLYKEEKGHMPKKEYEKLKLFIENKEYISYSQKVMDGTFEPIPQLKMINKKSNGKKRQVFVFDENENFMFKFLSYLLGDLDYLFNKNLYSFRRQKSVKNAIYKLASVKDIHKMYSYKVDIKDYFNSGSTKVMCDILDEKINDKPLLSFLKKILLDTRCYKNSQQIHINRGLMAGVSISSFFANLYLSELDCYFYENNINYIRYSDDIIVFAKEKDEVLKYENIIKEHLKIKGLCVNESKEVLTLPYEKWEFLGFSYERGKIDISKVSKDKLKAKMKRKAKALLRWKNKNNASYKRALRAFIITFNKKLYNNPIHNDITWARWYFPIINTDEGLKEIDKYYVECLRFIYAGRYSKSNYNLTYDEIKSLGFKSLVNTYYKEQTLIDKNSQ